MYRVKQISVQTLACSARKLEDSACCRCWASGSPPATWPSEGGGGPENAGPRAPSGAERPTRHERPLFHLDRLSTPYGPPLTRTASPGPPNSGWPWRATWS